MARIKNIIALIEGMLGKVNPRYDLTQKNYADIVEYSKAGYSMESWRLVSSGFRLGYAQGLKAARAAWRKGE